MKTEQLKIYRMLKKSQKVARVRWSHEPINCAKNELQRIPTQVAQSETHLPSHVKKLQQTNFVESYVKNEKPDTRLLQPNPRMKKQTLQRGMPKMKQSFNDVKCEACIKVGKI